MGAALRKETWPIRLAVLGVTVLIFVSSLILVMTPLAFLWGISHLSLPYGQIYVLALIGCPAAILAWGWVLLALTRVYNGLAERDGRPVLEASITLAVLIATAAILSWVFFLGGQAGPTDGAWPG
jgi:hypothetical protein